MAEVIFQKRALEKKEKELRKALAETPMFEVDDGKPSSYAVPAGRYVLKFKQMAGRKTLDKEALIDAGIDVDNYMKQGKPYLTISVDEAYVG